MDHSPEQPGLWRRAFSGNDFIKEKTRLDTAFLTFRARTKLLLEKIAYSLPTLTVHDITHVDALWETADLILGPHYPINPMEAFVLGGAMLLHDSALCFEAYENGLQSVRDTVQWRDAYASENEKDPRPTKNELERAADFTAIRLLHAEQASNLVERAWVDPDTKAQLYLIEDADLRKRYGQVIGEVASSHSWSIEDVGSRLRDQINAPGNWPAEWRIDPVKLACILRCADAAHIDNRRAPDFLHALTRRSGISFEHWKAQNWLARVDIDQADQSGHTLVFTSNHDFGPDDADAWWVAHDAIQLVEAEISTSNSLLKSRPQRAKSPEFSAQRVAGISTPEMLSAYVRTRGWHPWAAKLHVGNIENLVKSLGGENLYGKHSNHFGTALRELIQNARDAIIARRQLEKGFSGKIKIQIVEKDGSTLLNVIDDGVGMSHRVMAGPLLDFGTSFWTSNLMKEEFPGLRSSRFQSVGRFGIGFYSIFMVADDVRISSRRWDKGLDSVCSMHFPKGISLRPIVSVGNRTDFTGYISTNVSCKLKSTLGGVLKIPIRSGRFAVPDIQVDLQDFLARLVTALDVIVELQINGGASIPIHSPIVEIAKSRINTAKWLSQIIFEKYSKNDFQKSIQDASERARPITSDENLFGLAALNFSNIHEYSGIRTIGGFTSDIDSTMGSNAFVGCIDFEANSAKREISRISASKEVLQNWALEQIELLKIKNLNPNSEAIVTCSLADLNLDPSMYFRVLLNRNNTSILLDLKGIYDLIKQEPIAVFKGKHLEHVDTYVRASSFENYPTLKPVMNSSLLSLELENGVPARENSFISCLYRHVLKHGHTLTFETRPDVTSSLFGNADVIIIKLSPSASN